MDKFCLYILIKCIFKSVDIIFKLFVKYLNYFEVSKKNRGFSRSFFFTLYFPTYWKISTTMEICDASFHCSIYTLLVFKEHIVIDRIGVQRALKTVPFLTTHTLGATWQFIS
jgi:hypothetical protein